MVGGRHVLLLLLLRDVSGLGLGLVVLALSTRIGQHASTHIDGLMTMKHKYYII
jgi:hypothetical protein